MGEEENESDSERKRLEDHFKKINFALAEQLNQMHIGERNYVVGEYKKRDNQYEIKI